MSAKDRFHNVVKSALVQDGWTITHDPLPIDYGDVQMQIDLGAERLVAAERRFLNDVFAPKKAEINKVLYNLSLFRSPSDRNLRTFFPEFVKML